MRAWLGPSVLYLGIVVIVGSILNTTMDHPSDLGLSHVLIVFFITAWLIGFLFCVVLPFRLENRFSNPRILHANCPDYRLAGLTGHEMLTGLAAPQLAGIKLLSRVYMSTVGGLGMMLMASVTDYAGAAGLSVALVIVGISLGASMYNLLVGARYNLAQWVLSDNQATRRFKTALFVFSCPITLCTICPLLIFIAILCNVVLFVVYVARSEIVSKAWALAQSRLDGNAEVFRIVNVPIPKSDSVSEPSFRNSL